MNRTPQFLSAIPVLPAASIAETIAFYEQLGFSIGFQYDDYAGITRDGIQIHFWQCGDRHLAEQSGCRIQVRNIESLYQSYQTQQVIHPQAELAEKPWGLREFAITDPNGNLLTFAEPIAANRQRDRTD